MTPDHAVLLARANRWANERLYAAAATLSDADRKADRGAFFGSIHATLNHLLVADRLWLGRIDGSGDPGYPLDTILYEDFAALTGARIAEDDRLADFCATLTPARLAADWTYRDSKGRPWRQRFADTLAHVFNHQTHHRGQIHCLLSQAGLGQNAPSLDIHQISRVAGEA